MSIPSSKELVMMLVKNIETGKMDDFDQDQLMLYLSPIDIVRNWIPMASSDPSFQHFETDTAEFAFMPLGAARFRRTTTQSIDDDTPAAVSFDDVNLQDSSFTWSASDPTKIVFGARDVLRMYVILGTAEFATDADGYRGVFSSLYDSGDVLIAGSTMAQLPALASIETHIPFASVTRITDTTSYITITVRHTAGAALNLNFIRVALFRIF